MILEIELTPFELSEVERECAAARCGKCFDAHGEYERCQRAGAMALFLMAQAIERQRKRLSPTVRPSKPQNAPAGQETALEGKGK